MSRKHFVEVAKMIAAETDRVAALRFAEGMANLFQRENERFDRNRFMSACGF